MSSYDQNLLGEAPKATRAQLQEGYNVDLLEQPPPRRTPSVRTPPSSQIAQPLPATVPLAPGIVDTGSGEKLDSPAHTSAAPTSQTSFWRSRNGIITIIVVVLIVIGVVVGGAVGGTVKKGSNKNVATTGLPITPAPSTTSGPGQGFGGNNSTSASSPTQTQTGQNTGGQVVGH